MRMRLSFTALVVAVLLAVATASCSPHLRRHVIEGFGKDVARCALAQPNATRDTIKCPIEYTTAFEEFAPLAQAGDADAQYKLGVMYAEGHGVSADGTQAVYWFRKAAEQGNADAQLYLGVMYMEERHKR